MKSRIIAGLLSLFLGSFGIHRFYLKDIPGGIFYIFLFFITFKWFFPVSGILGIIEAVRIFNMSNREFDEKYNKAFVNYKGSEGRRREDFRNIRDSRPAQHRDSSFRIFPKRNPFKKSALEKYKVFDFKGAISDYTKALDITPDDPEIHFQIAKAYSLTENKEMAFRHLDTAKQCGLREMDRISSDPDLAFIRIQGEFAEFKANGYRLTLKALNTEKKDILDDDLLLHQIKKLNDMREKGIINTEEFELEKKRILNK
jgi:TM2 domain-containing membrane protein YozV